MALDQIKGLWLGKFSYMDVQEVLLKTIALKNILILCFFEQLNEI